MSSTPSRDTVTRDMLAKTLTAIEHLTGMLDGFLEEEKATLAQIEATRQHLKELESKCANFRTIIEGARASRDNMETIAHDLRCILSPIKSLPTEILIKIFSTTIEDADEERRLAATIWDNIDPDRTSLILAQVCMRWRHIFSTNTSLWNHIELYSPTRETGATSRFAHYTKLGSCIQQSLFMPCWDSNTHELLLKTLPSAPTSYKRLEIDTINDPVGFWDVMSLNATEVILYRDCCTNTCRYFTPLLQSASKVTIYGKPPEWGTVPWPTLQTLIIKQFCFVDRDDEDADTVIFEHDGFVQLLDATPSLVRVQLDFWIDRAHLNWTSSIPITHTRMEYLSIHLHHLSGGKGAFGVRLDLPALQTLDLLSMHCDGDHAYEREIKIDGLAPKRLILPVLALCEVVTAAGVLHSLSSVERLDLTGPHSGSLLRALHPRRCQEQSEKSPAPIPKLLTLHIDNSDIEGETLAAFVAARLAFHNISPSQVQAVELIHMYETPGVTVADWNKIKVMLEEGRLANGTERY